MSVHRSFVALSLATVLSTSGTRLSAIAIPWLVLTTTGSPVLTGLAGFAEMLPYVVAKALGGPLIDRIGARRVSVWCDMLSAAAVALVPLLFWAGLLSIWVLLPAVALIGVLRAPPDAAKQALVPMVAALGKLPMERVTGVMGASDRLAGTLGAAGAGILIALLGPAPALLVNALAFVLSALAVGLGIPAQHAPAQQRDTTYQTELSAGWTVLRNDPVLVSLVIMIAITNLFDMAYSIVLLPVWVRSSGLDVSWVGILLATFSAGAIFGAAIAAAVGHRLPRLLLYTAGFFCCGPLAMSVLALDLPLPVIVTVLLFGGISAGSINPIIGVILFERVPAAMTGRVVALFGALAWALMPFGGVYAGLLVDSWGISIALGVTAMLYLVAAFAPLIVPSFRQMKRQPLAQA
ncbi:MFS transporter [Devosia sp. Root635]|uniref:MFS transporter n=1 Tax=Devosia sp. Root635 TaxID=1736575 RepID=UPI0006FBF4A1|nr:MFS transporter [Devosia sp. Root635]KRA42651.1 MFS transporter permease [Devosia sp. Root635]